MSYKKPQVVAKSATKQSYVAGCPAKEGLKRGNPHDIRVRCMRCEVAGA